MNMKTSQTLSLGIASSMPNIDMTRELFLQYYGIALPSRTSKVLVWENSIKIVLLWVDSLVQRVMSWDIFLGIAGRGQLIESFGKQGKIPLEGMTQFGYRDDGYRSLQPVFELVGDGYGEKWFEDANKFWFRKTGETEEIQWRKIPLYTVPFSIDNRWVNDVITDEDFPVWITSMRVMRKNPQARRIVKDISDRVSDLYNTSWYYRNAYPRG